MLARLLRAGHGGAGRGYIVLQSSAQGGEALRLFPSPRAAPGRRPKPSDGRMGWMDGWILADIDGTAPCYNVLVEQVQRVLR